VVASGCLLGLSCGIPRSASAQEHLSPSRDGEPHWELAGIASYLSPPIRGGTSPFGGGFGGRIGFTVAGVYLGASAVDYLGQTDVDASTHAVLYGGEIGYGLRLSEFSGVSLTLRPQVGVGGVTVLYTEPNTTSTGSTPSNVRARADVDVVTTATARVSRSSAVSPSSGASGTLGSSSTAAVSDSTTTTLSNVYVEPSVALLLSTPIMFVGVNANVLIVPGLSYAGSDPMTWIAYGIQGQLGVRF
jgi:hypothetical protein